MSETAQDGDKGQELSEEISDLEYATNAVDDTIGTLNNIS